MSSSELRDRYNGQTIAEWINDVIEKLDYDLEHLHGIVAMLRRGFGLNGQALDDAVRWALTAVMEAGGRPTQGHNDNGDCYRTRVTRFGDDPAGIVEGIIAEWKAAGVDPDIGDVWFGSSRLIAIECRH